MGGGGEWRRRRKRDSETLEEGEKEKAVNAKQGRPGRGVLWEMGRKKAGYRMRKS